MSKTPRNHRCNWTVHELTVLGKCYGQMDTIVLADILGRSVASVRLAARELGCRKIHLVVPWSEEELNILREQYAGGVSAKLLSVMLPGRNPKAIATHARKLGVQSGRYLERSWNEQEIAILRQGYPSLGVKVAQQLPGRTENAVKLMANKLGIQFQGGVFHGARQRIWTDKEWQKLEANFHLPPSELLDYFPGRTVISIAKAKERLRKHRAIKIK